DKLLLDRVNADFFAVLVHSFEFDFAVNLCEQGVVGAFADVLTGMDVRAALFDKNVAGEHELTVRTFYAESFVFGVTAVFGGTHTFFVRKQLNVYFEHYKAPLSTWIKSGYCSDNACKCRKKPCKISDAFSASSFESVKRK